MESAHDFLFYFSFTPNLKWSCTFLLTYAVLYPWFAFEFFTLSAWKLYSCAICMNYCIALTLSIVYYRPSAIPGPVPDEIVLPATDSIGLSQLYCKNCALVSTVVLTSHRSSCCCWPGVKLLLKMGWRHGHSISDSRTNSLYGMFFQYHIKWSCLSSNND